MGANLPQVVKMEASNEPYTEGEYQPAGSDWGNSDPADGVVAVASVVDGALPPVASEVVESKPDTPTPIATKTTAEVVAPATRGKAKLATRGKKKAKAVRPPAVDCVKVSKNTYAFRFRFNSLPGRPVEYVVWVSEQVYKEITSDPVIYEQYKAQLQSLWRLQNEHDTKAV